MNSLARSGVLISDTTCRCGPAGCLNCTERCAATQIQATLQGCQIGREIWQPCIQSQNVLRVPPCVALYIYIKATQIYIFFSFFIYIYINIYIYLNFVPTTLGANHQNVQTNCDRNNGGRPTVQRRGFLSVQRALSPLCAAPSQRAGPPAATGGANMPIPQYDG